MDKAAEDVGGLERLERECRSGGLEYLHERDRAIGSNSRFKVRGSCPRGSRRRSPPSALVLLLHGLNEKNWDKYGPWAEALARRSGAAVLLVPAAFHMERAPALWSEPAAMRELSRARARAIPGLRGSSLANAALSRRLDESPARMLRSGLQTVRDFRDVLALLRAGSLKGIAPGAATGYFGYSIGAFILQAMAIADPLFLADSKAFLFSGGPFLDGMEPVSRYIMDSEAHERLIDYWVRDLRVELRADRATRELAEGTPEGEAFVAMCSPAYHPALREKRFAAAAGRMECLNLSSDSVMPPGAARECLAGSGIGFTVLEAPSQCGHENPFPPLREIADRVGKLFDSVFGRASDFLFA